MDNATAEITIFDSAPRDGLSKLHKPVSTSDKILVINNLAKTGVAKIDCVAFTHPRVMPKDSDAEKVIAGIEKQPGVTYVGLASTEIGCRRAVLTDIDEILTYIAASEVFNRAVQDVDIRVSLNKILPTIIDTTFKNRKTIRVLILTAFGCPYSGNVAVEVVEKLVSALSFMGVNEISLVDTTGMANPKQVKERISGLLGLNLKANLAVHFHDNKGTAMANCLAAYEAGIRTFDTATGGLSGTAYGAPQLDMGYWNIPTEDLVHVLGAMDVKTGVDFEKLLECVEIIEKIAGSALPGHLLRARRSNTSFS